MPTLPNMGLVTPTAGGDSGTWDDKINAAFVLVDEHDHTSGKGTLVPVAGIDIDADFAMGGNAVTGLGSIAFNAVTALAAGSKRLFVSSSDNELYWRTNGGTNVKLTNGTSINTTLVGGIVGDYSSVGAEVAFSDADQAYTFKDQSSPSKKWARLASGPVRIYENDTTESVYVEHAVATALAGSYTVTWPAAVAAGIVQIDGSGVVSFSSTLAAAPTASDYKISGTRQRVIPAIMAGVRPGTNTNHTFSGTGAVQTWSLGNSSAEYLKIPIPLDYGDQILNFTVYAYKTSDATNTITAELVKYHPTTGVRAVIGTDTEAGNAIGSFTFTLSSPVTETMASPYMYTIEISQSDATPSGVDLIYHTVVDYKRP